MFDLIDIGIDFETFYDQEYSLTVLENAAYVMDARFQIIGVSIKISQDQPAYFFTGTIDEVKDELSKIDWSKCRMVSHNVRFDGSIMEWRLGLKPAAYLCTMVGSRPHFAPYAGGQSLADISSYLGLGSKGSYIHKTKGMHREDFDSQQMHDFGLYAIQDIELSFGIRDRLIKILPWSELRIMDLTLKKYLRPTLNLNKNSLLARLSEIEIEKDRYAAEIYKKYGMTSKDIRSRTIFASKLKGPLGGDQFIPRKINKNGQLTYAFAKDDIQFKLLLTHPDETVRDLVKAKMTLSSTLEESRIKSLISLYDCMGGWLPVPLVYYGAHTGRLAGDHGINLQNLPSVRFNKDGSLKAGHLRFAVTAPPGYSIVSADFSNIEARIVAALAGQWDLLEAFRNGRDVYSEFATLIYGRPINKKDNPVERFVGKTCILGLGYGMGFKRFHLKMMQEGIIMDFAEACRIVRLYRKTYSQIPLLWKYMEGLVSQNCMRRDGLFVMERGNLSFVNERIILPNGMPIVYPGLMRDGQGLKYRARFSGPMTADEWMDVTQADSDTHYGSLTTPGTIYKNLWGGTVLENSGQALAGIIAKSAEIKLADMNLLAALQVHDELVWRVPTKIVDKVTPIIEKVMTEPVDWLPLLPIAVEIHHGATYGQCK